MGNTNEHCECLTADHDAQCPSCGGSGGVQILVARGRRAPVPCGVCDGSGAIRHRRFSPSQRKAYRALMAFHKGDAFRVEISLGGDAEVYVTHTTADGRRYHWAYCITRRGRALDMNSASGRPLWA